MALIVEDGSQVANANSYISLDEARTYAALRGVELSADDDLLTPIAIRAMDYVESFRTQFSGYRVSKTQRLQWPRSGAEVDGFELEENEIPQALKDAQAQLMMDSGTSGAVDLMPTVTDARVVKMEKVDVLEKQYDTSAAVGMNGPVFTKALALLEPLFGGEFGGQLSVVRA